jgi:capsular polysaccharide biosynthesis protein
MSPKSGLITAAGLFCGILIGMIGAIGRELRDGILSESWQIEQFLEVPVLTSIKLPEALPEKST